MEIKSINRKERYASALVTAAKRLLAVYGGADRVQWIEVNVGHVDDAEGWSVLRDLLCLLLHHKPPFLGQEQYET